MCGIAGIVASDQLDPQAETRALAMRDVLTHRGPDGAGLWSSDDNRIVLGHRRLAIIDTSSAGAQPMRDAAGAERRWVPPR